MLLGESREGCEVLHGKGGGVTMSDGGACRSRATARRYACMHIHITYLHIGNGKTTLVKLIIGELRPTEGEIVHASGCRIALVRLQPRVVEAATHVR